MPNRVNGHIETGKKRKFFESWSPSIWRLDQIFVWFAMIVGAVAAATLVLWVLVTFVEPFFYHSSYYPSETSKIPLGNGQALQIKYPNRIRSDDSAADIILILSGKSKATEPVKFTVEVPSCLTVIDPVNQSQIKTLDLLAATLGDSIETEQIRIGVWSLWPADQAIVIKSMYLKEPIALRINGESFFWLYARGIVNNTINDKSALILLVTGFLSGAGTLVMQYMKTHRDQTREELQKKEERFYKFLQDDFEGALNVFLRNGSGIKSEDVEDFLTYKGLVEESNWYYRLSVNVVEKLKNKQAVLAIQSSKKLIELCKIFDVKGNDGDLAQTLSTLCNLTLLSYREQDKKLVDKDAMNLLVAYLQWTEELGSIIGDLVQEFSKTSLDNAILIKGVFEADESGKEFLRNANLQNVLDIQSITNTNLSERDFQEISNVAYSLNWRPLWSGQKRMLSSKILRWLSARFYEHLDEGALVGSEYAELDSNLNDTAIHHPVFDQMGDPFLTIVFGDEGMGKTATALLLTKKYQDSTLYYNKEAKVFPVYAAFEAKIDVRKWLAEKMSQALINFTADNPRRFLNAPDAQKVAMGRLMLWYSKSMGVLQQNLSTSPFNVSVGDRAKILEFVSELKYLYTNRLTKDDLLNLLYSARPDAFDSVFLLWDIPSAAPQKDVVAQIKDVEEIAIHLARQNVVVKIFAPLTVKESIGNLVGFCFVNDLTWAESQLSELLGKKMKDKFNTLWDRSVEDPVWMIVQASAHSPRRLMKFLFRLIDYVDEHLQEDEKLTKETFDKIVSTL